jgi:hypothetical protein
LNLLGRLSIFGLIIGEMVPIIILMYQAKLSLPTHGAQRTQANTRAKVRRGESELSG